MIQLKEICDKQEKCKSCPLLIKRIVKPDSVYDYHETFICYLEEYDRIKEIEDFLKGEKNDK